MKLIIDGREAVPIRRIPAVTGITPPQVVLMLAQIPGAWSYPWRLERHEKLLKSLAITAYRLDDEGKPEMVAPKEFDGFNLRTADLWAMVVSGEMTEYQCHMLVIELLPPRFFVWWTNLQRFFSTLYETEVDQDTGEEIPVHIHFMDEREGDRKLNIFALPYAGCSRELEFAGFENFITGNPTKNIKTPPENTPSKLYSLPEAFTILKLKPEPGKSPFDITLEVIRKGDEHGELKHKGRMLNPSIIIEEKAPVRMRQMKSYYLDSDGTLCVTELKHREELPHSGLFTIIGADNPKAWCDGWLMLSYCGKWDRDSNSRILTILADHTGEYAVTEHHYSVHQDDLVLQAEALDECYYEHCGQHIAWPKEERSGCDRAGTPERDEPLTENRDEIFLKKTRMDEKPVDYAARRKSEGATTKEIACELRREGCHLSTIGKILKPLPSISPQGYGKRANKLIYG